MRKIPTGKPIVQLNGETIMTSSTDQSPFTIGRALANIVAAHQGAQLDRFKLWTLAKKFYQSNGDVSLDEADFQAVRNIVREDKSYPGAIVSGQIEEVLASVPEQK